MVLLIVAAIVSCTKEPIPNGGNNEQPTDTIPNGNDTMAVVTNGIHFGDTTGMIVTMPDSTSYIGNYGIGYFSIDANNDGVEDARLITQDVGSAGLGHANVLTLKSMNDHLAWYGETFQQELYFHADSSSWHYVDPDYPQFDSICVIHVLRIHTCERIAETDTVISVTEKFAIFDKSQGDELKMSDYFETADVVLRNRSYEIGYEPTGWGTDNLIHVTYYQRNNCEYFPLQEEKYIGFKYTDNENNKFLGWIKIIIQCYYDYGAILLETAIQK